MCVCMCVCVYIYTYIQTHATLHIYRKLATEMAQERFIYTCTYVCVCVRARARAYVCINTYYFDIYRKLARQKGKRHAEYMAGKQAEQEVSNVGLV